jgi:DNA-binding MarR family transcriptional regulator
MRRAQADTGRAWQLLVKFFFAQRGRLLPVEQGDLSPVQCHVLHLLEPGAPVAMRELAETLSCDASNVTGLVDRLEARGLVARRPSPRDRRVKVLDLTPTGSRLRAELLKEVADAANPLARLTPREQRTLIRILERLLAEE